MSNTILRPSTGTNHYYAQKHGEPIRNVLDNVLAGWCESYQPTGASNSLDAAEMLCKGTAPDFSRPAPAAPAPAAAPREFGPQPADYGSTFGTSTRAPAPVAAAPAPVESAPLDLEWALAPGHGWSAQDSQRQLQALAYCDSKDPATVMQTGFSKAHELSEAASRKSGWGAALVAGGFFALAASFTVAPPLAALALAGGGVVAAFRGVELVHDSHQDHNNGAILGDMATRLHQATYHTVDDRHTGHGNYAANFNLARG